MRLCQLACLPADTLDGRLRLLRSQDLLWLCACHSLAAHKQLCARQQPLASASAVPSSRARALSQLKSSRVMQLTSLQDNSASLRCAYSLP